jgi:hypothetical protein
MLTTLGFGVYKNQLDPKIKNPKTRINFRGGKKNSWKVFDFFQNLKMSKMA